HLPGCLDVPLARAVAAAALTLTAPGSLAPRRATTPQPVQRGYRQVPPALRDRLQEQPRHALQSLAAHHVGATRSPVAGACLRGRSTRRLQRPSHPGPLLLGVVQRPVCAEWPARCHGAAPPISLTCHIDNATTGGTVTCSTTCSTGKNSRRRRRKQTLLVTVSRRSTASERVSRPCHGRSPEPRTSRHAPCRTHVLPASPFLLPSYCSPMSHSSSPIAIGTRRATISGARTASSGARP